MVQGPRKMPPVGVFDSGVGGLSVVREIRALAPGLPLLYVADSLHLPYGEKSPEQIIDRACTLTRFLVGEGAVAVVVACNTATAFAVATLRRHFRVPIVAIEPGIKPAVAASRSGRIGVLATRATLASQRFADLRARYAAQVELHGRACPDLVECVERGELETSQTRRCVERHADALRALEVDTVLLGCTHFPFLRPLIESAFGPDVCMIDNGRAVALELLRRLPADFHGSLGGQAAGVVRCYTSGELSVASEIVPRFWGQPIEVMPLPAEFTGLLG